MASVCRRPVCLALVALCAMPSAALLVAPRACPMQMLAAEAYSLHDAAKAGDASAVELLLLTGVPPNVCNARGSTPLHLAALFGHADVATALLDAGAPVSAANEAGATPLHAAVEAGQASCAALLLSRGAEAEAQCGAGLQPLQIAARAGDAATVSALLQAGAEMGEAAAHDAFWAAVRLVEATPEDGSLAPAVPRLLQHVFDADMRQLSRRGARLATNVTCLQPAEQSDAPDAHNKMDEALLAIPLKPGRACHGGECCDACSRVVSPAFTTVAEADAFLDELRLAITPPLHQFSLQKCAFRDARTTLLFVRLVERMRRALAAEYGLRLATITPLQCFVSCFVGAQDKQGGLHSDEATHREFHYSAVLYLSTQGVDFEGGGFAFNDAAPEPGGARVLSPLAPSKGAAVLFSSGWENYHEVEPLLDGTRFALPGFFGTRPAVHAEPADDAAIADELWRTLLSPQSADDVRLMMMDRWHSLLAPGR